MATNKNINECGWFYHAPAKKSETPEEPVETPYISQIPGLSDIPDDENSTTPQGMYFKDTDTKYIQLSKQGGRKDLLVFKDQRKENPEPQGYPRVDWFYLQDNAREDAAKSETTEPWKFLKPEYMVHDSYVPSLIDDVHEYNGPRSRVPYAVEKQNIFQTEGNSISDKRVKIQEPKQHGYGVRNSKPAKTQPQLTKTTTENTHQTNKDYSVTKGDKIADMHHILSYDYERQWHEQMQRTNSKQPPSKPKGEPPIPSEYEEKYGKSTASPKKSTRRSPSPTSRRATHDVNNTTTQDKEIFKLSKFKNVPAKIDSHQAAMSTVT